MSNQVLKKMFFIFFINLLSNGFDLVEAMQTRGNEQQTSIYCENIEFLEKKKMIVVFGKERDSLKKVEMIHFEGSKTSDKVIEEVLTDWPCVEELILKDCTGLTNQTLAIIAERCRKLKKLYILGCTNLTGFGVLQMIVYRNENLRLLWITKSSLASSDTQEKLKTTNKNLTVEIGPPTTGLLSGIWRMFFRG